MKLSSTNVKNVKSNLEYVTSLLKSTDICCIQEHWLFGFQQKELVVISPSFSAHAKSVDMNDPIPPVQVPRGYGGTAILYKKNWDIKVDLCPDGCDRINVLVLHTIPKLCVINVYMPCRGNNSKDTYSNTLAQVEEKYRNLVVIMQFSFVVILTLPYQEIHLMKEMYFSENS